MFILESTIATKLDNTCSTIKSVLFTLANNIENRKIVELI